MLQIPEIRFRPDMQSSVYGADAHPIQIVPIDDERPDGPCELARQASGAEFGDHATIEPGFTGYDAIRAIRLWIASRTDPVNLQLGPTLLASSTLTGLVITSCVGYDTDRDGVSVPNPSRLAIAPFFEDVILNDVRGGGSFPDLVEQHLRKAEGFDPYNASNTEAVDLALAGLLVALPAYENGRSEGM